MTGKADPRALRYLSLAVLLSIAVPLAAQEAAEVQPVDLSGLSPADFRDEDLRGGVGGGGGESRSGVR